MTKILPYPKKFVISQPQYIAKFILNYKYTGITVIEDD